MKTKILNAFLIVTLFLAATPFSFAQTTLNDWSVVKSLAVGTNVFIKTSKGKTLIGSLVNVRDNEVELAVKGRNFNLPKDNLESIYFAVPKTGRRGGNIGAIIGAAAIVTVYVAAVGDEGDSGTGAPILPFIAGGLGGGFIGSLFGKGNKKGALIYKAK